VKPKILFVDDERNFLNGIRRLLHEQAAEWDICFALSAEEALQAARGGDFDLVVSDFNMPGKDGLALLSELRRAETTRDLPVVILTGRGDANLKRRALDAGANDLLTKPTDREDLLARIRNVLKLKSFQDRLKEQNTLLDQRVRDRTAELEESRMDIALRLAKAAEYRDEDTGKHVLRVGQFCRILAEQMHMTPDFISLLFLASPLHDIGKIGVSDTILLKPGRLTPEERMAMEEHTRIGFAILLDDPFVSAHYRAAGKKTALSDPERTPNALMKMAAAVALTHHERWNGTGYPRGLAGEDIPLEGRLTALADVYDALSSDRPYKKAFPEDKVLAIIREENRLQFDPAVCAAFEARINDFREIRRDFSDAARTT